MVELQFVGFRSKPARVTAKHKNVRLADRSRRPRQSHIVVRQHVSAMVLQIVRCHRTQPLLASKAAASYLAAD